MYDVSITDLKLPRSVRGVTAIKGDGTYCVFVNNRYSGDAREEILREEMQKIERMRLK